MWGFISKVIGRAGHNRGSIQQGQASADSSDDETCSNNSLEMECHICYESFNIVENVPYVLWCGHTLCRNCLLGLQLVSYKFPSIRIQIPFFVSCPWCHFLSLRLVYRGNLKFPSKNYFLVWMLESLNDDRMKFPFFTSEDHQPLCSTRSTPVCRGHSASNNSRTSHCLGHSRSESNTRNGISRFLRMDRPRSFYKSLDILTHLILKILLVILFLVIVLFAIPASFFILALYFLITVVCAVPAILVMYIAYTALDWLAREIVA